MSLVLGVEGGGSHSHAVVASTSGEILGAGISRDPANWEDVGIEAAGAALKSCARSALSEAGVAPQDIATSVFALAGVDFPVDEQRLGGIPEALRLGGRIEIMNDAFASFRAGSDRPFGLVVVAGTGSVVAGPTLPETTSEPWDWGRCSATPGAHRRYPRPASWPWPRRSH